MTLPDTETRCLGIFSAPMGDLPCLKRKTCARYVQRHHGKAPMAMWLCPTKDNYYGAYIEQSEAVALSTAKP